MYLCALIVHAQSDRLLALDRSYVSRNPPFENLQQISVAAPIAAEAVRFRRELSDHWPIVIEFEERADDD